ncbi:hypothetical protein X474_21120 [Dethiosulfatarculus sandiegensis]|uniref:Uncharacterized protein n=1 Tax=Dethiosulfatarculus sandiegensis TaxID=1429043 RepID=A0A0D2J1E5_9BACT|nr:hypothetical protein X474_21120 [Dethiosulfatarculus sandiegensis]
MDGPPNCEAFIRRVIRKRLVKPHLHQPASGKAWEDFFGEPALRIFP